MTRYTGPLRTVAGANSANINAIILQAGTREAGTAADALKIVGSANATTSIVVTQTNASFGQNTTITTPDPGTATAKDVIAPAALVSGNLVSASGTAGLVQDSGVSSASVANVITQVGTIATVTVTLNTAAVAGAYATPAQLLPAPGAGKAIVIQEASVATLSTGNTPYATGTVPVIQYGNAAHGAGTIATSALASGDITASTSQVKSLTSTTAALSSISNVGIFFSNATGAYTAGTGTNIVITLTYQVLPITV